MKVTKHRNGKYSITDLTKSDLENLEASLYMRFANFLKSSESQYIPSGYSGWTIEQFRNVSVDLAEHHLEMSKIIKEYAWPEEK